MELFKKDNFFVGLLMGVLLPVPLYGFFYGLDLLLKRSGLWNGLHQPENIFLLSMAGNALLFRVLMVRWGRVKAGKGMLFITIILVLAFFFVFYKQPH